ncbi:hypothetical protein L1987_54207 [Smallanthus sonchifolius]|uniref:Uncharacterized protein n=1 Tax=Smallanthus sonchifolius TaxID=185202 RepID=A0ACB9E644_9ASTR|nr:hypothetical protein L1987_54207 [Smallanthus sonchifolius]
MLQNQNSPYIVKPSRPQHNKTTLPCQRQPSNHRSQSSTTPLINQSIVTSYPSLLPSPVGLPRPSPPVSVALCIMQLIQSCPHGRKITNLKKLRLDR